jgi:hypothetical protein
MAIWLVFFFQKQYFVQCTYQVECVYVTYNFKRDTVIMLFDSAMLVTDANDDFSGKNVFPLFVIRTSTALSNNIITVSRLKLYVTYTHST